MDVKFIGPPLLIFIVGAHHRSLIDFLLCVHCRWCDWLFLAGALATREIQMPAAASFCGIILAWHCWGGAPSWSIDWLQSTLWVRNLVHNYCFYFSIDFEHLI
jgi:hypothetical protein